MKHTSGAQGKTRTREMMRDMKSCSRAHAGWDRKTTVRVSVVWDRKTRIHASRARGRACGTLAGMRRVRKGSSPYRHLRERCLVVDCGTVIEPVYSHHQPQRKGSDLEVAILCIVGVGSGGETSETGWPGECMEVLRFLSLRLSSVPRLVSSRSHLSLLVSPLTPSIQNNKHRCVRTKIGDRPNPLQATAGRPSARLPCAASFRSYLYRLQRLSLPPKRNVAPPGPQPRLVPSSSLFPSDSPPSAIP